MNCPYGNIGQPHRELVYSVSQSNEVQNYLRSIITACTSLAWERL